MAPSSRTRILIVGAAGRDFHNFNVRYRGDADVEVVAFTATQIPGIDDRRYPAELAGPLYPAGIPIEPEQRLEELIAQHDVDLVVFAYSDITHEHVMHIASRANAAGAAFLLSGREMMLRSTLPVVSVTATRTGVGKSQTSRQIREVLAAAGKRVAAIRHPMPYGNLVRQRMQRFASFDDLDLADVTIEEREEYEPYLREDAVIFAGADYEAILRAAEAEAEIIVWDGGNNDVPFIHPDIDICMVDPHRVGHGLQYWPGEANLRRAGIVIINKIDSATSEQLEAARATIAAANPDATIVEAESVVTVDDPAAITGKKVLVVEDGPTTTHGGMAYGAGMVAARLHGAAAIVDPRPHAAGSLKDVFATYPHLSQVLPAMGYSDQQRKDLRETIHSAAGEADVVVVGTPINLAGVLDLSMPWVQVRYDLNVVRGPAIAEILAGLTG